MLDPLAEEWHLVGSSGLSEANYKIFNKIKIQLSAKMQLSAKQEAIVWSEVLL